MFHVKAAGGVTVGQRFIIGPGCRIAPSVRLEIGNRVSIGADFTCQVNLTIADDVMISSGVAFIGNDHPFSDPSRTIQEESSNPPRTVNLAGNNLVGHGTIVIGDVNIGEGAIVGAGSLVTSDLPPNTICVGRPARPVRNRYEEPA